MKCVKNTVFFSEERRKYQTRWIKKQFDTFTLYTKYIDSSTEDDFESSNEGSILCLVIKYVSYTMVANSFFILAAQCGILKTLFRHK